MADKLARNSSAMGATLTLLTALLTLATLLTSLLTETCLTKTLLLAALWSAANFLLTTRWYSASSILLTSLGWLAESLMLTTQRLTISSRTCSRRCSREGPRTFSTTRLHTESCRNSRRVRKCVLNELRIIM